MVAPGSCAACGSTELVRLNTYKHYWYACQNCSSIVRRRKNRYFLEALVPERLAGRLPGYFTYILPARFFNADQLSSTYDYYANFADSAEASGTKWDSETQIVVKRLEQFGLQLKDKSVLDISGGPGFVANNLRHSARYILLTEFSEKAVEGMRTFLYIDVAKYDYNTDALDKITDKKFDVILVRFSINFCEDLEAFATQAKRLLNQEGILYIEHVEPNAGCILRWQFDEYTYNVLYGVKVFADIFERNGFSVEKQQLLFTEPYHKPYWNYSSFKTRLFYFFVHRIRAVYRMLLKGNISRELAQRSWVTILKST